jgi:imidazolonepropionase-like amidohydrolase/pimeloyl-ACP methyl ester carboxylesterase
MDHERVLPHQTVVVSGDRITNIGPAPKVQVPEAAVVIDGRGRYLMPGLADMHAHVLVEDELILFIANGVTTARNMAGGPEHLAWRARIKQGDLVGPTIYTAGPFIDGDPPEWPDSTVVTTHEQAQDAVSAQKKAGYDFLKVYNSLTREAYDALTQVAKSHGIPVTGHVPRDVGLHRALAARQRCIEHLDGYEVALISDDAPSIDRKAFAHLFFWLHLDTSKIPDLVCKTREAGTWNCPTLIVPQRWVSPDEATALLKRDEFRYVAPEMLEYHLPGNNYLKDFTPELFEAAAAGDRVRKRLTKALHDGGARILLGTDCANPLVIHGFSLHEELRNFVDAGLTPYQAIKAGTHDAAEFFDALDEFGTVTEGRRGDLLLLEENPLDNVSNVAKRLGVMVRGKWYPQAELQARLEALAEKYAEERAAAAAQLPATSQASPGNTITDGARWTKAAADFRDGPAILKGTIFIPDGESAVPGVVILGGSERGPRTRMKERLAEHFASTGVAALIYDSAGTGQSTGNALLQTRAARAEEAIAAVHCLRSAARTHPDHVGILGISEGALVTMLAAARDQSVAFALPVSGGFGVPMMELARYRIEVKGMLRGLKPQEIQKALLLEEILFALMAGPNSFEWRLIDMKAGQWSNEAWRELADIVKVVHQATSPVERQEKWDALRRTMKSFRSEPWFDLVVVDVDRFDRFMSMSTEHIYTFLEKGPLANGDFDKVRQELNQYPKVSCPVLAVWGENDEFLPPHRCAGFLKSCLKRAGHKDATFHIVPDASHILTTGGDDGRFAGAFPDLLTEWLSQRFVLATPADK